MTILSDEIVNDPLARGDVVMTDEQLGISLSFIGGDICRLLS